MLASNHRRGRYAYLTYPRVALGCLTLGSAEGAIPSLT